MAMDGVGDGLGMGVTWRGCTRKAVAPGAESVGGALNPKACTTGPWGGSGRAGLLLGARGAKVVVDLLA